MLQTIQGIYKNGKIELSEIPQGITESYVFVTFLQTKPTTCPEIIIQHQGIAENITFIPHKNPHPEFPLSQKDKLEDTHSLPGHQPQT